MVNPLRISEMIAMARYDEAGEGGEILRFYRSDYVALEMIKSVVCTTIGYMLVLGLAAAARAENLLAMAGRVNPAAAVTALAVSYLAVLGLWLLITFVLSMHRYNKAAEQLGAYKRHLGNLKDLLA